MTTFIVHHSPNNGRYDYDADPNDAVTSAKALIAAGEIDWVAGNCWRMISIGDFLLFKFGAHGLKQPPGIYAAGYVTQSPIKRRGGRWVFGCKLSARLSRQLMRTPIVGSQLKRVAPRSFGASIQLVQAPGQRALGSLLGSHPMPRDTRITRALLVRQEPLDKILSGTKTWEIRSGRIRLRGRIALIQSKSGMIVGTCEIVDVVGPLALNVLRRNARRAGGRATCLPYRRTYAWVLHDSRRLRRPVPYEHPSGAIVWVKLTRTVIEHLP